MAVCLIPREKREAFKCLVKGWEETMILSCIQGHMGEVYGIGEDDSAESPIAFESARFVVGDFCFLAGKANRELAESRAGIQKNFVIMAPQNREWENVIEAVYKEHCSKTVRYAIKKEGKHIFDRKKLAGICRNLEPGYELKIMDHEIYQAALREEWSRDLCANFEGAADYCERGVGAAVLFEGNLVSGASSYTVYDGGIEIEIDTREEFRRKGLALAAGAKLILECLDRGLYPSWDAQNLGSVCLAEKLGYHFDRQYTVYEVTW